MKRNWLFGAAFLSAMLVAEISSAAPPVTDAARVVDVDAASRTGPIGDVFKFCVGADRAAIHLRPTDQRDLKVIHDQCGFKYVRFHGLLDDEMGVVTGTLDAPIYHWTKIDAVFNALRAAGMRPFVEVGFMPSVLASGKQTIFYYKGNTTPPASYPAWGKFITALTRHLTDRYGADEVKRWYFEVWNEPNLDGFWHGTQADYFHLYDVTSRAIKGVNADYQVGGPATAGLMWISEFLNACHTAGSPVDFVTGHTYGVRQGALDERGTSQQILDESPDAIVGQLPGVLKDIAKSPTPGLPLFITEWSTSYSPRDPVHDSYLSAPYILSKLRRVPKGVASMSYWTFSDQFEEAGPVPSPFHGGFGLLNAQGLPKPAFFAYQFLNRLGPTALASTDTDSYAATDAKGNVQVLFWDLTIPHLGGKGMMAGNQSFFPRDWPADAKSPATVRVQHLPAGDYTATVYRVGYRHNDVYTAYVDLGKPAGLAGDGGILPQPIFDKLKQACTGAPESQQRIHVDAGQPWSMTLPMNQNDVYLVTLTR